MKIKEYMEKEKLSYRKFADRVGVAPGTVFHFLSGKTNSLSLPIIQKIVNGTRNKVTFEDIMEETGIKRR